MRADWREPRLLSLAQHAGTSREVCREDADRTGAIPCDTPQLESYPQLQKGKHEENTKRSHDDSDHSDSRCAKLPVR